MVIMAGIGPKGGLEKWKFITSFHCTSMHEKRIIKSEIKVKIRLGSFLDFGLDSL